MRVGVASVRPAKVDAVRDALRQIGRIDSTFGVEAEVVARAVATDVSGMPMSDAVTLEGARQRAERLFALLAGERTPVDYAVGLEGGLDAIPCGAGRAVVLRSWAYVTDGRRGGYGAGGGLMLPAHVVDRVEAGAELGDVIDRIAGAPVRGTRGAWGMLTRDLISRRDAFAAAVISAFARFYNAGLYEEIDRA